MASSLSDRLRMILEAITNDPNSTDEEMNKQLKLLELYIEGLTSSPDKCRILLKSSGVFQTLCTPLIVSAFVVLGFSDTEGSLVFLDQHLEEVVNGKEDLLKLLAMCKRYNLTEVSEYVARGEKPPGILEVDDRAVAAQHSEARMEVQAKPWQTQRLEELDFSAPEANS